MARTDHGTQGTDPAGGPLALQLMLRLAVLLCACPALATGPAPPPPAGNSPPGAPSSPKSARRPLPSDAAASPHPCTIERRLACTTPGRPQGCLGRKEFGAKYLQVSTRAHCISLHFRCHSAID